VSSRVTRETTRSWWLPALLFLAALLFLLAFHRYNLWDMTEGWVIADEGHQVYQPLRWMAGQWYYRDFSTDNYPPGYLFLHAVLFKLFGVKMSVIRVFLSFVGAGIATLGYIIARRVMPAGWAAVAYLFCLSWNVVNLNMGYPSWYCALLGLAALWAALRYDRDDRVGWLLLVGTLTGLSLALKTTQGLYQWIGIALFLAWRSNVGVGPRAYPSPDARTGMRATIGGCPYEGWKRRLLSWETGLAGLAFLLAAFLLRTYATPVNLLVFGLPILLVSIAVILGRPACVDAVERRRLFILEVVWLGLGMVVVTAAWAIPTITELGWDPFIEGTFLSPLRHSVFMHAAIRPPSINGWLMIVWAAAGGLWLLWGCRVRSGTMLAYGIAGAMLLVIPFEAGFAPREALRTAFQTWLNLRFYLFLLVALVIWWMLWRRQVPSAHQAPLVLLLAYGSWNFLQVYPFADSNHLLWSIQPAFIGLAYLAYRMWETGRSRLVGSASKWSPAVAVGTLPALLIAIQFYPLAGHFYSLDGGLHQVPYMLLGMERADVRVREDAALMLQVVAEAIEELTREDDTIFDASGSFFYFVTGRHNATKHDFLWPGFLTDEEVAQLIRDLEGRQPALIVRRETDEHVIGYPSFANAFPSIAEFIESHYQPEVTIEEYALWSRK